MRAIAPALILLSTFSVLPGFGQSKSLPVASFPKGGGKLSAFCPKGWEVENKISLDLNKDNKKDLVLQLMTSASAKKIEDGATQYRALVVVFGDGHDSYTLGDYADKLLLCTTCGGQLGANIDLTEGKECFTVSQNGGGGNDGFGYVFTFSNTPSNKFHVDKAEFSNDSDRVGNIGKTISINFRGKPRWTVTSTGEKRDKVLTKAITAREIFMRDIDLDKLPTIFKGYQIH